MKKILSLFTAMLCLGTAGACVKKAEAVQQPLTVIVMDTTQALLDKAEVTIGRTTVTTSFDGKVVLKPEMCADASSLLIHCDGYNDRKIKNFCSKISADNILMVSLTPKSLKAGKEIKADKRIFGTATHRAVSEDGLKYKMETASVASAADYAVETEGFVMAEEMMPMDVGMTDVMSNNVSAGLLTAGEVNDFAKWYFWPGVLDGTHMQYVQEWQFAPRHRYTAMVTNNDGYPVVGRAVSLLDNAGNTLFQAMTDNTGKAELWYQLVGKSIGGKQTDLQIRVDDQVKAAKEWSEGINVFKVDEPCEASKDVDVVFVFDVTGSMGDELRYLQEEMKDVISRASAATGDLKIRTGAVVYRDHDDEYLTRISRLTDDIATTQAFIDKQEADGGGDYPEAVPEALMAAMNSTGWNFNARARIAFLILDAPCHQDSSTLALLHEQILNAAAMGVRIVPVVCSGLSESGELLVRSIVLATNGTSFFLTDDSGIGHTHLKPTTDNLKVEHLNDMLVRTIFEFSAMPACNPEELDEWIDDSNTRYIPNPFETEELAINPDIPHGEGIHYLVDVTGKLIGIYEGEVRTDYLPVGVYFIKTYMAGHWFTDKILVR